MGYGPDGGPSTPPVYTPDPSTQKPVQDFENAQGKVHANLSDINNYALYMSTTRLSLTTASATAVGQVTTGMIESVKPAAQAGTTYEIATMANKVSQHASDFKNFFADLANGIYNIGNAAQVISDAYGGTDGLNAAKIDGVDFAFADGTGTRPPGLSKDIGQTVSAYNDQQAQKNGSDAMALQADPDHPDVGAVSQTGNPYVSTYTYADGSMITVESVGGGTVTTFYGPPKTAGGVGAVLGSQDSQTTYGTGNSTSQTVTQRGADGKQIQQTTTATNDKGTDITISTGDDDKNPVHQHIDPNQSTTDQQNDPLKNDPLHKTQQELNSPGSGDYGQVPG